MAATKCQLRHGGRLFKGMTIHEEKVWEVESEIKVPVPYSGKRIVEKGKVVGEGKGET